jgi:DNA-binding winged helix-turn-helix (wHTH) protein/Tfp pilus assembly protein PilF
MDKQFRQFYEFGPFRLEVDERRLWCDGAVVPLTPKAFDLLLALVAQPGHLLEKETLLKTLWPDSFVEENNLADNISKLRKALGEGENGQRFIETVPRRGYRFVAEVKSLSGASTAPAAAAESPVQTSKHLRWNRRPEVMLIAGGFVLLLLIGAGLYLRTERERVDVHELEFKGNFYLSQWTEAEIRKGLEYYQRAAALAPHAASAQAGLATAWLFLTDLYVAPREAMPQAKAAALQALQLAETEIDANISLALIKLQYDWDWAGAEAEFQHALALAPDYENAHQFYGWYLMSIGRLAEAQAELKRVAEANALNDFYLWSLGLCLYFAHQDDQAIEQFRRAIALEPRSYWPHLLLGWVYAQQGKATEAAAELQQARRLNGCSQTLAALGYAYAVTGQRGAAQQVLAELQELARHKYISSYDVATIYAGLGEQEQALAWLERAYEERSGWLALWLKVDPKFDSLRREEQFRDLLRRVGHTP